MKSIKKEYTNKIVYQNEQGDYHRIDGPAIERNDGYKAWWINGQRHREDGPAVEYYHGGKEWYLNGRYYLEEEWKKEVVKIKLNVYQIYEFN